MTADAVTTAPQGTWQTLRRGLALSPELRTGLLGTLVLAILSMVGRVAVPIAIQQRLASTVPRMKRRSQAGISSAVRTWLMNAL